MGTQVLAEPPGALLLSNGIHLLLRPLGPDDRDELAALFARLSPESRFKRFLSPKRELTPRELAYFTDIDHLHHEAIAAVNEDDGSIAGVARYIAYADRPGVAEVSVEVADELQGVGIGTVAAIHVVRRARANGLILLTATTLWENQAAHALTRRLGFRPLASRGREVEWELALVSRPSYPATTAGAAKPQSTPTRPVSGRVDRRRRERCHP